MGCYLGRGLRIVAALQVPLKKLNARPRGCRPASSWGGADPAARGHRNTPVMRVLKFLWLE